MLRYFKSASARRVNLLCKTPGAAVWQRNYYEHLLRGEGELADICRYIRENPLRWLKDEENKRPQHPFSI